jgi:hypothetical protein
VLSVHLVRSVLREPHHKTKLGRVTSPMQMGMRAGEGVVSRGTGERLNMLQLFTGKTLSQGCIAALHDRHVLTSSQTSSIGASLTMSFNCFAQITW